MSWYKGFDTVIAQQLPHLRVLHDEPMSGHTTFRIGGPARRMAFPASPEELAALLNLATEEGWPWMVAGNGSDLLVDDAGLDLLVIVTTAMDQMERTGETTIRAWAGISLARLAVFAMEQGLAGLAFAPVSYTHLILWCLISTAFAPLSFWRRRRRDVRSSVPSACLSPMK